MGPQIMDIQDFLDSVRNLTDLELAVLLSLIAQQHCLIACEEDFIDDLSSELALIASEVFNLSYAVVSAEEATSVEKFGETILDQTPNHDFGQDGSTSDHQDHLLPQTRLASVNIRAGSITPSQATQSNLDSRTVANVVIAKYFNHASEEVQVAALELITRRRIYSHTTVHQVPKTFLFIPLISTSTKQIRLTNHLNDRISISHHHDLADGFANLEELDPDLNLKSNTPAAFDYDKGSTASFANSIKSDQHVMPSRQIHHTVIDKLREMGKNTVMTPEIRRYTQDIIVFLRLARGVDGGVTPFATTQFVNLAKYLAPLHGVEFVTPSLVALAARKVYPHRVVLAAPDRERSMQWGSDGTAVQEILLDVTAETVIEEVLLTVPSPV